jgi:DNA repair protein RadC
MSQIHSLFVQDAQGQYIVADDDTVVASALRIAESRIPRVENVFHTPDAVKNFLCLKLGGLPHEIFGVMFVNSQNGMIAFDEMFRGTVSQTSVYPREVVKRALQLNAAAVVLVHNHPSGSVDPSRADEHLTQTLKSALALVDVRVLDHIIVGGDRSLSMAERGLV